MAAMSTDQVIELTTLALEREELPEAKQLLNVLNARTDGPAEVLTEKEYLNISYAQKYFHDFIFRNLYPFNKIRIMSKGNKEVVDLFVDTYSHIENFKARNYGDSVLVLMAQNELDVVDFGLRRKVRFYDNILRFEAFESKLRTIEDEKLRLTYLFWTNYYFGLNYANITFAGIGNQANNIRNAKSYIQDALDIFYEMKERGIEPDHDLHHINVDGLQVGNMHLLLSLVHKAQIDRKRNADKDGTIKAEMLKEFKLAQEYKSPYAKYYEPYMLDLGN